MKISRLWNILLIAACVLLVLGIMFLFAPCGPKEDGTFMNCHRAGEYVKYMGIAETVLSAAALFVKNGKQKSGLYAVTAVLAVITAFIPGGAVHLCMMAGMRCRAVMRPATIIFSIIIVIFAVSGIISELAESKRS